MARKRPGNGQIRNDHADLGSREQAYAGRAS